MDPNKKINIVVGMSGGVDSSVSALLLKQQGYNVTGLFMKNWEEQDEQGVCRASYDFDDVSAVCHQLDIPYYAVNFSEEYRTQVFTHFLEELQQGFTPNPDILCNREIKFNIFFEKARELGADFLATGHYCQKRIIEGEAHLLKGADADKDQSYFLYAIKGALLPKILFPIGHLSKKEVRAIAREHGLATANKKNSTGICFIGKRNFRSFIQEYLDAPKGHFETVDGVIIGEHIGLPYYTIGQRKGLAIGGKGDAWFVVAKDIARNVVIVAQGAHHPRLYSQGLTATELSWIGAAPSHFPFSCHSKIRYRQQEQECQILSIDEKGKALVHFKQPQRAVTPRQSIVFYQGEVCLGGGLIEI